MDQTATSNLKSVKAIHKQHIFFSCQLMHVEVLALYVEQDFFKVSVPYLESKTQLYFLNHEARNCLPASTIEDRISRTLLLPPNSDILKIAMLLI